MKESLESRAKRFIESLKDYQEKKMKDHKEIFEEIGKISSNRVKSEFNRRTLMESINFSFSGDMSKRLTKTLKDWSDLTKSMKTKPILIGGLAVDYWCRKRYTEDVDVLFLSEQRLPSKIWYGSSKFKPFSSADDNHPRRLFHRETEIEIDVNFPKFLKLLPKYSAYIYRDFAEESGLRIASVNSLILTKLTSYRNKDKEDIEMLVESPYFDLNKIKPILTEEHLERLISILPHDYQKYQ